MRQTNHHTAHLVAVTIPVREPSGVVDLPGERKEVTAKEISEAKHIIVYAERGHRQQDFIDWLKKESNIPWIELHFSTWDIDFSGNHPSEFAKSLQELGESPTAEKFYSALNQHESNSKEMLICKGFEALKLDIAIGFAIQFRRFGERHPQSPLHILSTSSTYLPFSDKDEASGYAPLCRQYRLANYNAQELCDLEPFKSWLMEPHSETITHILQETGGQPLLVKLLGQRLELLLGEETSVDRNLVDEAMRQMRSSPPGECSTWKSHLKRSLEQQKGLLQNVTSYVRGETLGRFRFPPPIEEMELYTGGWLALNEHGRWGMTSRFHAYLASQVLDILKGRG